MNECPPAPQKTLNKEVVLPPSWQGTELNYMESETEPRVYIFSLKDECIVVLIKSWWWGMQVHKNDPNRHNVMNIES